MISFYDDAKENTKKHNPNWPQILDYPYRLLVNGGLDLEKQIHYFI